MEWVILVVKAVYENGRSSVCLNGQFSDKFSIKVSDHQGTILNPLLFT